MDVRCKFDLHKEKKFLHIIYSKNEGVKIKNLRLKNDMTLKQLSKEIGISEVTLTKVENNRIRVPYYYWKLICDFYKVDHISYLGLCNMDEDSIENKLIKIRAYLGAKRWGNVGSYLGYSEAFIVDMLTRYTPNKKQLDNIDITLRKIKITTLFNYNHSLFAFYNNYLYPQPNSLQILLDINYKYKS
ncbi:MAG: helix-turn-helix transcriptional regulator [Clostridiaceae bacterium]